jgi:hypothetical protein
VELSGTAHLPGTKKIGKKIHQCDMHIHKIKENTHMITSIDQEKVSDKI